MGEHDCIGARCAEGERFVPIAILPPARGERAAMVQNSDAPGGEGEGHGPGITAIGPVMPERKVREWALVLQSSELWHAVRYTPAGWVLLVRDEDYDFAATSIDRYEAENRDWPPRRPRERPRHPPSVVAGVAFAALALFFFLVTGPASGGGRLFQRGASVADLVIGPEPWRAITALTLHADSAHVIGNVISGTVFASAVQRRLGPGGAALAVVASGAIGNLANALWHESLGHHHASIGASTAVFGAIGLLAATQLMLDRAHDKDSGEKRHLLQLVAPLVGGLSLLGALGASPRADLGAHVFGLISGAAIGLVAGLSLRNRPSPRRPLVQVALGATATGIVLGAWQLALRA
ncbi:rhomboid family intramembrane serine protease [Sorangium sp. So ce1078]|uniref:rhomboid family intramembrane serine protease n=1 Tax=Sorangium sp. So ce1078 TaxID=3133329 RepID=UPI003F6321BF